MIPRSVLVKVTERVSEKNTERSNMLQIMLQLVGERKIQGYDKCGNIAVRHHAKCVFVIVAFFIFNQSTIS